MNGRLFILIIGSALAIWIIWSASLVWNGNAGSNTRNFLLEEAPRPAQSLDSNWWLASGAYAFFEQETIKTFYGDLPEEDIWRRSYLRTNPMDTDNGYHPQNIFRLFAQEIFTNSEQQVSFLITGNHLSPSLNRNESSGVFLFFRYTDADNHYYAGLTKAGQAQVVKKFRGIYYPLARKQVIEGEFHRWDNPNLLPLNTDIKFQLETKEVLDGLSINLYINEKLVLSTLDDGEYAGPVGQPGLVGLRSDFMDVVFSQYQIKDLQMP